MGQSPSTDAILIQRIRAGETDAWNDLIKQFEGRLLAYVFARLRSQSASEDVVQETFVGFLTSLPNYDLSRPLESYLFSIAAHKLTDHLRREGRRPTVPLVSNKDSQGTWDVAGRQRAASSVMRSGERRNLEIEALSQALRQQIEAWRSQGEWTKIQCMELLFVRGTSNKQVAADLGLTEQQVANFKFDFLAKIRKSVRHQKLPRDVFPELHESS